MADYPLALQMPYSPLISEEPLMGSQMGQAATPPPAASPVPPPIPQAAQFFVATNGQQTGPFGEDALAERVRQGQVTADTLVWQAGMPQWARAADVATLAPLFREVPPPLPPPVP